MFSVRVFTDTPTDKSGRGSQWVFLTKMNITEEKVAYAIQSAIGDDPHYTVRVDPA